MTGSVPRFLIALAGLSVLLAVRTVGEEDAKNDDGATWHAALETQRARLEPQNLKLLSIQISKLPRDAFGQGKLPPGITSVRWFQGAGSGTTILGSFEMEPPGQLTFVEERSSLETFVDDSGKDLTENPGEEEINEFFESNKKLSVKLSKDYSKAVFAVRGYSAPTAGTESLRAKAQLTFLSLSQEKAETQKIDDFAAGQKVEIGPVSFTIYKADERPPRARRFAKPAFDDEKLEWALELQPRRRPLKSIELLDEDGEVIKTFGRMKFKGKAYREYLRKLDAQPKSIRVTWYEQWGLVTVPIEIETPLSL